MAYPVADNYACSPGNAIAGGRSVGAAWRGAIALHNWAQLSGNTMASVDPALDPLVNPNHPGDAPWVGMNGHPSTVSAWSGAAWDEARRRLWITGGGHADYAGNEVYAWDADTGAISRLNNPSGAVGNTGVLNDGLGATNSAYFDGRPRSAHTYNNLLMRNGVFWNFQGSTYSSGFGICGAYRFENNDWVRNLTDNVATTYGGTIYDPNRDMFFVFGSGTHQPIKYNPVTDGKTQFAHWANFNASEGHPVFDSARDLCVMFTATTVHTMPLNDSADSLAITQTGTIPPWTYWATAGVEYDEVNDRYLCWNGGQDIYVLTPPATNPRTGTWTWSIITPLGGTVTAPAIVGTYGRFWYSPSLKCCGVLNSTTERMHVFALE